MITKHAADVSDQSITIVIKDNLLRKENHDEFFREINHLLAEGKSADVVCDLKELGHIDSLGMAFFVKMHLSLRKKMKGLVLKNVNSDVLEVFRKTGLGGNFRFN